MGGAVAKWLMRWTPDRMVGSSPSLTALCLWARHFTLMVPLSTQVYKWYQQLAGTT